jgi:hypothetical protein
MYGRMSSLRFRGDSRKQEVRSPVLPHKGAFEKQYVGLSRLLMVVAASGRLDCGHNAHTLIHAQTLNLGQSTYSTESHYLILHF